MAQAESLSESVTMIHAGVKLDELQETEASGSSDKPLQEERSLRWSVRRVAPVADAESKVIPFSTVPPEVFGFVKLAGNVAGVRCIVIEEEDEGIVHATTFVDSLTDELAEQIYEIEATTIEENPQLVFDFHLRRAEEATGSAPSSYSGKHYFGFWGSMGADGSRSSPRG